MGWSEVGAVGVECGVGGGPGGGGTTLYPFPQHMLKRQTLVFKSLRKHVWNAMLIKWFNCTPTDATPPHPTARYIIIIIIMAHNDPCFHS